MPLEKLEKILLIGIKIGVFLTLFTPLILGPFGITFSAYPKAVFFRSLIEIIFILYLLLIFLNSKYLPKFSPLVIVVSVFVGVLVLTSLTGFNFHRSFFGDLERAEGVILHLHLLALFLILISVFNKSPAIFQKNGLDRQNTQKIAGKENQEWFNLFKLAVIVSGISSLAGILQKLGKATFYGLDVSVRVSGTLTNPDFFGPYMALAIFLAIFVLSIEKNKKLKALWLFILVLNCYTLILSGTRAAWTGMIMGIVFCLPFLFLYFLKLSRKTKRIILLGILFLGILVFLTVLSPEQFNLSESYFLQRIASIFHFSLGPRLDVWNIAFDAWKQRPILGWGTESFGYLFDKFFKTEYFEHIRLDIYYDYSHNKIIDLMSSAGLLGLLSYLSIFLILFYFLLRRIFRPIFFNDKKCGIILITFLIAYFVQTLFCFDTISTYLLFFLVLGFINYRFTPNLRLIESGHKILKFFRPLKIFLVSFLIFFSLICLYEVNIKPLTNAMVFPVSVKYEKRNPSKALSMYKGVVNRNTIYNRDFRLIVIERLIVILENKWAGKTEGDIVKTLAELRPLLEKDLETPDRKHNNSYQYLARIDQRIYLISKDPVALESMERTLESALEFNNQRPVFYRLMGELRILQNNYEEGEDYFQKAYEHGPKRIENQIDVYRRLGIAYYKVGDYLKTAENFREFLERKYYSEKITSEVGIQKMLAYTRTVMIFYCEELDDVDTCNQACERAIEVYPEYQDVFESYLDMLMQEKKKRERAQ